MELEHIFKKHNTDKGTCHNYYVPYTENFESLRTKNINILEIGVRDCFSLRAWKEYFPNATIYGMDIDPTCIKYKNEGFNIIIGDQNNLDDLKKFNNILFDIIIDDGSHFTEHIVNTFKFMFNNNLKNNGIYVIEDLGCSYMKNYGNSYLTMSNPKGQHLNNQISNDRNDIINLFEEIHINMDINHWTKGREGYNLKGPVEQIYKKIVYYKDMCFIYKT